MKTLILYASLLFCAVDAKAEYPNYRSPSALGRNSALISNTGDKEYSVIGRRMDIRDWDSMETKTYDIEAVRDYGIRREIDIYNSYDGYQTIEEY